MAKNYPYFVWKKGRTGEIEPSIWWNDTCEKVGGFTVETLRKEPINMEESKMNLTEIMDYLVKKYPKPKLENV